MTGRCATCTWWAADDYDEPDAEGRRACWLLEQPENEAAPTPDTCGYAIDDPAATLITKPTFGCTMWEQREAAATEEP